MNCDWLKENLSAYVDGEMNFITRWRIKRHLKECLECSKELRQLEKIHKLSKLAILVSPESHFYDRLKAKLPKVETIEHKKNRVFENIWIALPQGGKAAILVGIALILFLSVIYPRLSSTSLNIDRFEKEYLLSQETLTCVGEPATSLILTSE
ncbi:zf-HC2 domain-containing protein [Candidatus Aerophobetes bacterium]|nr:zf-HC2 domain-containing protein [Candidatus Aerophobetes bacterium]